MMEVRRSDLKSARTAEFRDDGSDCWSGRCSVSSRTSEAWVEVGGESDLAPCESSECR